MVYDELAVLDDYEGIDIAPLTRELTPANPFALNLMRITVDGQADRRSTAQLAGRAALHRRRDAGRGHPVRLRRPLGDAAAERRGRTPRRCSSTRSIRRSSWRGPVRFRMYSNYGSLHRPRGSAHLRCVRIDRGRAARGPAVGADSYAEWRPDTQTVRRSGARTEIHAARVRRRRYVRRNRCAAAVDSCRCNRRGCVCARERAAAHAGRGQAESVPSTLAAAGGSSGSPTLAASQGLSMPQTLASTATTRSRGRTSRCTAAPCACRAAVLRRISRSGSRASPAPVDSRGNFVAEAILPAGMHTVEVAVLDDKGAGDLYLRDLKIETERLVLCGYGGRDVVAEQQQQRTRICSSARMRRTTSARRSTAASRCTQPASSATGGA